MPTGSTPVRLLDGDSVAELTAAAHTLLASHAGDPTPPSLLAPLPAVAASLSSPIRHPCRPVDTADVLFVLLGLRVDDAAVGP
ncbi:oxygenase, partial [Streptomyces scabiei]|nr:oxygenase [Streptomyces scabiei]